MQHYRKWFSRGFGVGLAFMTAVTYATTPASQEYVDQQAAILQAQIDTLNTIPAVAHPVGSCYGGGVVFYASADPNAPAGQRGLIAAPTDAQYSTSYTMTWQSGSVIVSTKKTYFTGEDNTTAILTASGIYPAATAANNYTVDGDTCTACSRWYLPSQDELATLYAQSTSSIALGDTTFWSACGGTTPVTTPGYWSSSQNNNASAFAAFFSSGAVSVNPNSNSLRVRAVRAF